MRCSFHKLSPKYPYHTNQSKLVNAGLLREQTAYHHRQVTGDLHVLMSLWKGMGLSMNEMSWS